MDNAKLGKFLNGVASEEEFKQYETWLEDAQTIVEEDAVNNADSLVASLRAARSVPLAEDESSRQLVERIGGVVAQQVISREEIERLLDTPQQADELGRIGKYRVIEFMAAGGMGLVFKAEDSQLGRLVCIKIMQPALALKPDARMRFERESRAAAQLRSERIVTLLDIGVQRDLPYIVMQLLDGESLRAKLAREGKLTLEQTLHCLKQAAEGLRHAHAMGILHRDIKPDNIWLTATGDIKLLDFGLARPLEDSGNLTTTGGLIGTPQYMSPEQVQGQSLDARSDLFSLGVVLFEMLTGTLPFQKNNLFSTMMAITHDSVSLPTLTSTAPIAPDIEAVLHRLLNKHPDQRIQSAQELMDQLGRIGTLPSDITSTASERTRSLTGASRDKLYRARYVLVGIASGLLAMLAFLLVMQATDKGTLVVRSDDPQVELRIAQDKVHVNDPLSGKRFEVQIGKTRLPGGVYQLEMNDAASGLTFSSNTIAIRRGETVIVEVELQPKAQVADTATSPAAEKQTQPAAVQTDKTADGKNADPSFQLAARENFARILASLPAQSLELSRAGRADEAPAMLGAGRAKLEGIDSWSIDTETFVDRGAKQNCDRTLLATVREGRVQIWDSSLKLKYVLRTPQLITQVKFDNKYPNLLAVCSYRADVSKADQLGDNSSELTVWRLSADFAEVLYRIPCQGYQYAWDQGYRLFHDGRDGLAVFRLDENKDYELHIPHEMLVENAVSTSGRYLATHHGPNIDVWDLHRGEFAFTSLSNWQVQWNQQGDRAAFFANNRTAFEIWDLEKRSIDDRVDVPSESVSRNMSGMERAVIGLEPTFQRLAWLSPRGNLSVRNLKNNREDSQPLPNASSSVPKSATLQWDAGTLTIETDQTAYVWTHEKSDVEGTLKERKLSVTQALKHSAPLQLTHVVGSSTPVLLWQDASASERNRNRVSNARDRQPELYFDGFDLGSNRMVRETPFSQARTATYSSYLTAADLLGPPYISFDGRYAISPNPTAGNESALFALAEATSPMKIELSGGGSVWGGVATVWDKTSRFAVISGDRFVTISGDPFVRNSGDRNQASPQRPLQIYDTQAKQLVDPSEVIIPAGKVIDIQRSRHEFVVITQLTPPARVASSTGPQSLPPKFSGELEVWRVDPLIPRLTKVESATRLLAKLGTVESIAVTDSHIFLSVWAVRENTGETATVRKYYSIAVAEEADERVGCVTVPETDELYFSPSGERIVRAARDADVIRSNDPFAGSRITFKTRGPTTLYQSRWSEVAKDLGHLDQFAKPSPTDESHLTLTEFNPALTAGRSYENSRIQWHPQHEVATWIGQGFANVLVNDENSLRKIIGWTTEPLVASDNGWTWVDRNEIQFFEVSGQPIGKLVFDPLLENMKPSRPRWQLPDGSLAAESGTVGLAISYQQDKRFYCTSVEEFERARPGIKLPRVSISSRFESLK